MAHWHLTREAKDVSINKNKTGPETIEIRKLTNRHYGVHQVDSKFGLTLDLNVVAVDPGRVNLISAVRLYNTDDAMMKRTKPVKKVENETNKQRRRRLLQEKMFELKRSEFNLSNKEWRWKTGQVKNQRRLQIQSLQHRMNMGAAYLRLAEASSRTGFADEYIRHVKARTETAPKLQEMMQVKAPRRWKFEAYTKEHRAVKKLTTDLLGGLRPYNTIIVWGNGGFGPSGKGHAPAPNKKLQYLLSKHLLFAIGSEYRSSMTSACHHGQVQKLSHATQTTRCAMMQCSACNTVLSRDKNAAHVIADIFLEMRTSVDLPVWISNAHIS